MPYIFLTDSDHAALREMLRERQGGRVNAPNRQPSRLAEEQSGHQAPEVYIALTPTDGIPARVGTTPGSAECVIQHIDSTGDLAEVASFAQPVYNVSTSAVAGDEYISVKRDKYGTWLADTGGGGAAVVLFTITDAEECGTGCVDATVTLRACGLDAPDTGTAITVEDEAGCFFNVSPVQLLGLKGFAIKMEEAGSCDPYSTESCHWVVFSMCCATGGCP